MQDFQSGLAVTLFRQQPARTFGNCEAEQSIEKRGKGSDAQHPAPGIFAHAREQRIRDESDQDAEKNVELKHAGKSSAMFGRRDLGDVERSRNGGDADAKAADEARDDK